MIIAILSGIIKGSKSYDFENPDQKVTVDTILQDYKANATSAAEKYSDKVVAVTGKVFSVNESYVSIEAYDDALWLYYVDAYMQNPEDLKQFVKGTTATVVGVCDNAGIFGDIKLEKSIINDKFAITPDYDNPLDVDAADIVQAYNDNPVSADETYKYKTITLTGRVSCVTEDYAVVEPEGTDIWDWDSDVMVYFETDEELASITEDSTITLIGECYGKADFYTVKICRAMVG